MARLTVPKLSEWNTFAGGTSAAPGKLGYDARVNDSSHRIGYQTFTIQPISSERGRHQGYRLTVYPGVVNGHESVGGYTKLYRSPQQAVSAARIWAAKNIPGMGMALLANPRVRFKVGDRVTIPWEGGLQQATVRQIKAGGRMVVEFPVSGHLHNVPTEWATKVSGKGNPARAAGPSVDRQALLDTLKHLNWVFGKGEIQSMEWTPGSSIGGARVKLQYGGQYVKFKIDSTGRFVTFRGHRREIADFTLSNPAARAAGPSAIPMKWVKARVSRVGKQIQIRMGGTR